MSGLRQFVGFDEMESPGTTVFLWSHIICSLLILKGSSAAVLSLAVLVTTSGGGLDVPRSSDQTILCSGTRPYSTALDRTRPYEGALELTVVVAV